MRPFALTTARLATLHIRMRNLARLMHFRIHAVRSHKGSGIENAMLRGIRDLDAVFVEARRFGLVSFFAFGFNGDG